jgi:ADP-ribosylglycohydrolase
MLPPLKDLHAWLGHIIATQVQQGHDVDFAVEELGRLPESYDAYASLAERVVQAPLCDGWPYVEPDDLDGIWAEADPNRATQPIGALPPEEAAARAEAAFLAAVAGCILGKPLEVNPTLAEIETAARAVDAWPLDDYIPEAMLEKLGRRHESWHETVRERIAYVAPDDDINYDVIAMLLLEEHGADFTRKDVMSMWLHNLPPRWTFGPERTVLIKAAHHTQSGHQDPLVEEWTTLWNPGNELCGAAIRVDAYGYACPGHPALAAELAWRDAGWTHRRTGIYGAMFIAASIAAAFVLEDRMAIFETALQYVPQRSRFYEITADCLSMVRQAADWREGYDCIHAKYGQYGHCQIYQEVGTLINTMKFAPDIATGLGIQVAQGADTDCFGEIIGSLLGAYYGPGNLDERWLAPFNDDLRTAVALYEERSLQATAKRMGALARRVMS